MVLAQRICRSVCGWQSEARASRSSSLFACAACASTSQYREFAGPQVEVAQVQQQEQTRPGSWSDCCGGLLPQGRQQPGTLRAVVASCRQIAKGMDMAARQGNGDRAQAISAGFKEVRARLPLVEIADHAACAPA